MTGIFIAFIAIIVLLVLLVGLAVVFSDREKNDAIDRQYINEDGDHVYYDKGLIEKKNFAKHHPEVNDVRSFRRLFKEIRKGKDDNA